MEFNKQRDLFFYSNTKEDEGSIIFFRPRNKRKGRMFFSEYEINERDERILDFFFEYEINERDESILEFFFSTTK